MCDMWEIAEVVLQNLWKQVDVPGSLLPGTPREAGVRGILVYGTTHVIETCDGLAGSSISAGVDAREGRSRGRRGLGEEPLWPVLSNPLPSSIAMRGFMIHHVYR